MHMPSSGLESSTKAHNVKQDMRTAGVIENALWFKQEGSHVAKGAEESIKKKNQNLGNR